MGGLVGQGYARVKLKIGPGWDVAPVEAVRSDFPDLLLQVDANASYARSDTDHLAHLDRFGLLCLEQPLDRGDLDGHAGLARRLATPVCLDESLDSPHSVWSALGQKACSVVCVKPGRLGGLGAAIEVIETCTEAAVPVWIGGMYESGYARGVNTTLAALPGMAWPGDLSPPATYLEADVVAPPVSGRRGRWRDPDGGDPRGGGHGPIP